MSMLLRAAACGAVVLILTPAFAAEPTAPSPGSASSVPGPARRARGVRVIQPEAIVAEPSEGGGGSSDQAKPSDSSKTGVVVPVTHSIMRACDRPFAKADLTLTSQSSIDRSLSNALKSGKPVVVDLAEPYAQNDTPPASLAPWFSAVKSGGGAVTVSPYCSGGRGVVRNWLLDIVQRLTGSLYKPARQYNATLYADATKRRITQIEFKPKTDTVALAK